ncbi:MAG: hypothetical protein HN392_02270 [Anaerolineae bacterium]|jgi:hypothetical protein|nr:hypothetical protein [Anaerolineae bacterium]
MQQRRAPSVRAFVILGRVCVLGWGAGSRALLRREQDNVYAAKMLFGGTQVKIKFAVKAHSIKNKKLIARNNPTISFLFLISNFLNVRCAWGH